MFLFKGQIEYGACGGCVRASFRSDRAVMKNEDNMTYGESLQVTTRLKPHARTCSSYSFLKLMMSLGLQLSHRYVVSKAGPAKRDKEYGTPTLFLMQLGRQ